MSTPFNPQGQSGPPQQPPSQPGAYPPAPELGQPGGYQAAPQLDQSGYAAQPPAPVSKPSSIATAVKLMYGGAALSVLSTIASIASKDDIRKAVEDRVGDGMKQKDIDDMFSSWTANAVVSGVIAIVLWIALAYFISSGKSWARIVATIAGVVGIVYALFSLALGTTPLMTIIWIVSIILAVVILVFLWKKDSTAYLKGSGRTTLLT